MKYVIHGDKVTITESIKKYIDEKLGKIDKYFENAENIEARVVIKVRGRDQIIEVTVHTANFTIRSEEAHLDLYAAIDLVVDKLERQIKKNKTKLQNKKFKNLVKDFNFDYQSDDDEEIAKVERRKKLEMKPMSEEEAILQIEMLGHDFFIYRDSETGNICVLYKRKDGNYGVIETN